MRMAPEGGHSKLGHQGSDVDVHRIGRCAGAHAAGDRCTLTKYLARSPRRVFHVRTFCGPTLRHPPGFDPMFGARSLRSDPSEISTVAMQGGPSEHQAGTGYSESADEIADSRTRTPPTSAQAHTSTDANTENQMEQHARRRRSRRRKTPRRRRRRRRARRRRWGTTHCPVDIHRSTGRQTQPNRHVNDRERNHIDKDKKNAKKMNRKTRREQAALCASRSACHVLRTSGLRMRPRDQSPDPLEHRRHRGGIPPIPQRGQHAFRETGSNGFASRVPTSSGV